MGNALTTKVTKINPSQIEDEDLEEAISIIKNHGIVGFPTETVYGLGASIYSNDAIKKIYDAKGRPQDNPLIVHISSLEMLEKLVVEISPNVLSLCSAFWPGPLTILFEKSPMISDIITAGLSTVAIRMPQNPIALRLIELIGHPLAAPSANISGKPSPTTAQHVLEDFQGKIPLILDGGPCQVGVESTVIDVNSNPPVILRPGGVNYERLVTFLPELQIYEKMKTDSELEAHPSTPGLKYRHYSPQAQVILLSLSSLAPLEMRIKVEKAFEEIFHNNTNIAYVHTRREFEVPDLIQNSLGDRLINLTINQNTSIQNLQQLQSHIAQKLFLTLRSLDEQKVEIIVIEGVTEQYEGLAIMNRLKKAAYLIK